MDPQRFDARVRTLGRTGSRRHVLPVLASLGLGGLLGSLATQPAAAVFIKCPQITCPKGKCPFCLIDVDEGGASFCSCSCITCGSIGIAGGGAIQTDHGQQAQFALLATRTTGASGKTKTSHLGVEGQVQWSDPGAGVQLASTAVTFYGPRPDPPGARVAAGWLTADGVAGAHPFLLRAVDAGPPGNGQDEIALWVGEAVTDDPSLADVPVPGVEANGYRYAAQGVLIAGDLQLLDLAGAGSAKRRHHR